MAVPFSSAATKLHVTIYVRHSKIELFGGFTHNKTFGVRTFARIRTNRERYCILPDMIARFRNTGGKKEGGRKESVNKWIIKGKGRRE